MLKSNKLLHHANLLVGSPEEAERYLYELCGNFGVKTANNPDFCIFRKKTFGVDEARELEIMASRKSLTGKKIFLISSERLTHEAQNALLKTFEDPYPHTHFFLSVREVSLIIPTLLSRMSAVRLRGDVASATDMAREFLSLSLQKRLSFAKSFTEEERNLPVFLDDLLLLLKSAKEGGSANPHGGKKQTPENIKSVYDIRRFANDTAVSARLILEHLSLVL